MEQANQIYADDYQRLQEVLKHYPGISILNTEKDPPEQYEIEYKLFGYGYDKDGKIQMLRRHRVEIKLPFGYPHFPPTVKPLTKICHPDVDEHALRIADYWQSDPSLADLVVHIGHMIRGEIYSTAGGFNSEATAWYKENSHKLPLAELDYLDDPDNVGRKGGGGFDFAIPFKLIVTILLVGAVAGGGFLAFRDKQLLQEHDDTDVLVKEYLEKRDFVRANDTITTSMEELSKVLLFGSERDEVVGSLKEILDSDTLQQGLQGKIEFQGKFYPIDMADTLQRIDELKRESAALLKKDDENGAEKLFTEAASLVKTTNSIEAVRDVESFISGQRINYSIQKANEFFSEKRWADAGKLYQTATESIQRDKGFLPGEVIANYAKLEKLRILSLSNEITEEALKAEKYKKFQDAVQKYTSISRVIAESEFAQDQVLVKLDATARSEIARVLENEKIAQGQEYLLKNFQDIFKRHYLGIKDWALKSPRVVYLGRSGDNLVFAVTCIEMVGTRTKEYGLSYQYDVNSQSWSIYKQK